MKENGKRSTRGKAVKKNNKCLDKQKMKYFVARTILTQKKSKK